MRKYLLHVLIISFVFLLMPVVNVFALQIRGIQVLIKDKQGKQVGMYKGSHALVIGIDNYTKGWSRLGNAVKDADMIAEELEKQGFEVTLKKDLTGETLRKELRKFFVVKGKNPESRLLLWFSGHGHTIDGEGFLVPVDAPVPTSNQFMVTSLHMRDFGGLVRLAKSKHVLSIFDSCFAGTIFNTRSGVPSPAITRATVLPVRQFLTSGDANQQVSDDGSFRELFLRAIRGEEWADANDDGYLTGSELGSFLSDRVTNLTHAAQVPRYGKLLDVKYDRGDFVFALGRDVYEQPAEPGDVETFNFSDIESERENARKLAEIKAKWTKWQKKFDAAYDKALKYDKDTYLSASKKVQVWKRLANSFSQDNPYSTEDQLIRSKAVERMEYWRNYREPRQNVIREEPSYKTYSDGSKYVGGLVDGRRSGQGTLTWPNGEKYVGQWKDDKKNGQGTHKYPTGHIYVGEWKDDNEVGGWLYWADGTRKWGYRKSNGKWKLRRKKPL